MSLLKPGSVLDTIPPFFLGLNPLDCDIFEIVIKHTFFFPLQVEESNNLLLPSMHSLNVFLHSPSCAAAPLQMA